MELINFIEKFKSQFIDSETLKINEHTSFRQIESYDSLTGMAILFLIQDEFDLIISEDIFKTLNTPKELFDYIKNKV